MKKVNIGLDLGIASVGWAIADEELNLLERGVRLFSPLDDNGNLANADRRKARSARRQTSRRKNLKKDFIKLLVKHNLVDKNYLDDKGRVAISLQEFGRTFSINDDENMENASSGQKLPYILSLRLQAVKSSIPNDKFIGVLYWYLSNRGFEYEVEGDKDQDEAKKIIEKNSTNLNSDLVVEIQKKFFLENGFYRSNHNRGFSTKQYLKELKLILSNSNLSTNFKDAYLKLFQRRRNFEQGPGPQNIEIAQKMAHYPMHQGLFARSRFEIDEKGKVKEGASVWEKTIGKCSLYPELDRAPKASFSAQIFNLLNDLNNITIRNSHTSGETKLTIEQKIDIINLSLKTKSNINSVNKYIEETFEIEREYISGLRQKAKNKEVESLITELTAYHIVKSAFKKANAEFKDIVFTGDFSAFEIINEIIKPCYKYKEIQKRVDAFAKIDLLKTMDNEQLKIIAENLSIPSETHALSFRALEEYAQKLLTSEDNDNYSKLSYEDRSFNNQIQNQRKYIPLEWVDELVASPTIKRGIRQALKVLNAIIKTRDYQVENIVVEMARETNDEQAKKNIKELQAHLASIKDEIKVYVSEKETPTSNFKPSKNIILKLWLYKQQNGRDPYDGKKLPDPNLIISNPNLVDIDHIIPYSQSFDDSRNNKVLTTKEHNSAKSNLSASQYIKGKFGLNKFNELFDEWKKMYIKNPNPLFKSPRKFKNLTDDIDYSNPANSFGFINRNLVDTRYIAREVLNKLQEFTQNVSENHAFYQAKVKTINGKMTNFISKMVTEKAPLIRPEGFNKSRFDEKGIKNREWNGHHSEDAFLMLHGALKNQKLNKYIEKALSNPFISEKAKIEFQKQMEEKYASENLDFKKKMDVDKIRQDLNQSIHNVKFSYMLTTRTNRKFSNETFYSGWRDEKGELHKVVRIPLKGTESKKLAEIFDNNFKYKIPMKDFDSKTFGALKQMFENNAGEKEPFSQHCDDKGRVSISVGKNNSLRKVAFITVIQESKNETEIINVDGNGESFFESMEWIELRLYKNIKGKNKVIPVTAANHFIHGGNLKPKTSVLEKIFNEKEIAPNTQPWIVLKYGTIIRDPEQNLYRVNGQSHSQDKIELKRLDGFEAHKQQFFTLNTKLLNWEICEINEVGMIKKITNF